MNFEKLPEKTGVNTNNQKEVSVDEIENNLEALFGKSIRCFKKWGTMGITIGSLLLAGKFVSDLEDKDSEWLAHVNTSLSEGDIQNKKIYESKINEIFGKEVLVRIEDGDRRSYFEKKEQERKTPEISGFMENGMNNIHKYAFDEKYNFYPHGWVDGEVGKIIYEDSLKGMEAHKDHILGGEFVHKPFASKPSILFYKSSSSKNTEANFKTVKTSTIAHELGHANDWESDMDLNLLERQELLLKVYERLTSTNTYHRDADEYHETFMDGTKDGTLKAVSEYWADICAEYFTSPESFQKKYPDDFNLVDNQVKKNDPTFDIFNNNRGAFDPQTGKIREVYQKK